MNDQSLPQNLSDEHLHRLAPTPTWSPPPPIDLSLVQPYDSFDDNYQDNDIQVYSTLSPANVSFRNTYQNSGSAIINDSYFSPQVIAINEAPLHHPYGTKNEKEEAKKESNRKSKAYERGHKNRIEDSHISNDKLINGIKQQFRSWNGEDFYLQNLLQKLFNEYKPFPVKKRRTKTTTPQIGNLNDVPSSSVSPYNLSRRINQLGFCENPNIEHHCGIEFHSLSIQSNVEIDEERRLAFDDDENADKVQHPCGNTSDESEDANDSESESSDIFSELGDLFELFLSLTL
uniref:Uncharacterized protein n=1 Tax=Panagrolaimus superbus TaxID=310955 RepID=A0A914YXR4_9BILA